MGDAMDNIEEAMLQLLENPSLLRDPAFRVFTLNRWPCLNEFYQSRIEKKKGDAFLADIEIERIFECADECEHLIDQLVVCNARGILKALYHNAHKFLTSCDGIYASEKWNATMIEETKHCVADNIYLAAWAGRLSLAQGAKLPHEHGQRIGNGNVRQPIFRPITFVLD
jgi:hypothetical protein